MKTYKRIKIKKDDILDEYYDYIYYHDYDDDYDDDYYYYYIQYEYSEIIQLRSHYKRRFLGRGKYRFYGEFAYTMCLIDLESAYSKEILRNNKLKEIFGEIEDNSNTIENILKYKNERL